MKIRFNLRVFPRYLIYNILLFIVPIVMIAIIYSNTIVNMELETKKSFQTVMENNIGIIDQYYRNLYSDIDKMTINKRLNTFIYMGMMSEGSADIMKVYNAQSALNDMNLNNYLMDYFFIYSKRSNIILTSTDAFLDRSLFYRNFLQFKGLSEIEWENQYFKKTFRKEIFSAQNILIKGNEKSMLTFVQSFPMDSPEQDQGAIVVLTDVDKIRNLFANANNSWFCLIGTDGRIITSSISASDLPKFNIDNSKAADGVQTIINENGSMISYSISKFNGWTYVMGIDYKILIENVLYIKNIAIILGALLIIIEILMATWIAFKNSKPVKKLIGLIENNDLNEMMPNHINEFAYLTGSVDALVKSNKELEQLFNSQSTLLKHIFFGRLLKSEFNTEEDLFANMAHAKIRLDGNYYAAIILDLDIDASFLVPDLMGRLDVMKLHIKNCLMEDIGENNYIYDRDESKIVFVLTIPDERENSKEDYVVEFTNEIMKKIHQRYGRITKIVVGRLYRNLIDVGNSFFEALSFIDERTVSDDIVILGERTQQNEMKLYYPLESEIRVINLTKAGNKEELKKLLSVLFSSSNTNDKYCTRDQKLIIHGLYGTFLRISNNLEENIALLNEINHIADYRKYFIIMEQALCGLCQLNSRNKKSHNNLLIEQILDFINKNYSNSDLSLNYIAERFHFTIVYLSEFFKEQTGENYSTYLSNLRLKNACTLIDESDLPLTDIAYRVGYSNLSTFRTAFKRKYDIAPNEYRENKNNRI